MRVLGISGSLRRDSHNSTLLRAARSVLPPGAELVEFDRLREIPPYDQDQEADPHGAVHDLKAQVEASDALLIATPEYNHSMPGQLKNALDWLSRPLDTCPIRSRPAAVVGASTGMFGAVWAQADARKVLGALGARVVDRELPVALADEAFGEDGSLADPDLLAEYESILAELAAEADVSLPVAA